MGNSKFKLSDMIPNAWFYKLKHMSKKASRRNKPSTISNNNNNINNYINHHHHQSQNANKKNQSLSPITISTVVTAKPNSEPPRRSSRRRSTSSSSSSVRRKPVLKPRSRFVSNSSSAETSSSESESLFVPSDLDDDPFLRLSSSTADIIIDLDTHQGSVLRPAGNNCPLDLDLPPILTKPINFDDTVFEATKNYRSRAKTTTKVVQEDKTLHRRKAGKSQVGSLPRKSSSSSSSSHGIKLRANSPRLASKKIQAYARKSVSYSRDKQYLSESFAVVKSSVDPQRDFRDSMVEMIVENNIRGSKDLEDLLACYLSLNSKQYHRIIVKAFEQIWFDMADIRM